jgi:hypothetical protein
MQSEDLLRLQRTLDSVDLLLPPSARESHFWSRLGRVVAAAAAAVAALIGAQLWSIATVALITAWRPTQRLLLAAAAATAAAVLLVLSREPIDAERLLILVAGTLPLVATAVWIPICLIRKEGTIDRKEPAWLLWGLALAALVAWAVPFVRSKGGQSPMSPSANAGCLAEWPKTCRITITLPMPLLL